MNYLDQIAEQVQLEYELASKARKNGSDYSEEPEIYIAKDLAEKVEGLVGLTGIADAIRKLSKEYKSEEEIALNLVKHIIKNEPNREVAADQAIRAGLAFLTQGAVAAPLEGIAKIRIKKNPDNTEYLDIYYAGPIRAAGGTAEALSVVVADFTRIQLGLDKYKPNLREIGRYVEEIQWYHRHVHLQYFPSEAEVETIIRNLPVCIDGEPTEEYEVANYRDLGRVETNRVRGGMCLVIAEGVAQKAPKLLKKLRPIAKKYNLNWDWLEGLIAKKAKGTEKKEDVSGIPGFEWVDELSDEGVELSDLVKVTVSGEWQWMDTLVEEEDRLKTGGTQKYLQEIPAGRPLFSHPSAPGGFTLRYGRTRATGYAAVGVHPATMYLMDNFIAIGTQIRLELPGKAAIVTPCDTINGPTIRLKNGDVLQVNSAEDAEKIRQDVDAIISLGDLLISAGDFLENNHQLMPSSYCEEWWALEAKAAGLSNSKYSKPPYPTPTFEDALKISKEYGVPLHPKYTLHWHDISLKQLKQLVSSLMDLKIIKDGFEIKNDPKLKQTLEILGVFHKVKGDKIQVIEHSAPLFVSLGLLEGDPQERLKKVTLRTKDLVEVIGELSRLQIKPKAPTRIGARMGRPEKAKPRKMVPAPHSLFPTGASQGRQRDIKKLIETTETSTTTIANYKCEKCGKQTPFPKCPDCGEHTKLVRSCPKCKRTMQAEQCPVCKVPTSNSERRAINIKELFEQALKRVGVKELKSMKGVLHMTSRDRVPEPLEKGILRANHNVYVFKDGTIRFDATNAPLTHFKPREIQTSIEKLKEIGYTHDVDGKPLKKDDQLLELLPQDLVLSDYGEESAAIYLLKTTQFVDDLLGRYYGLKPYYNCKNKEDLAGKLLIALAPHTSTGTVGRILGFTKARVGYANPCFHAAKRRDCDGDEDAVMLLLDALLNFSKAFLPDKRGGRMDAPLVITNVLNPLEVDDEVYDTDVVPEYPLEFYESTERMAEPNKIKMRSIGDMINEPEPFKGWQFTHATSDINQGPVFNTYSEGEMIDKLHKQLELAEKIRAVDERDVAERIISSHFIPDIKGNLRTFSMQKVRCTKCNAKYRRPPLVGKCTRCGGNLTLTVHKGTIVKYLGISKEVAEKYKISPYLRQQIELFEKSINSIFAKEPQSTLSSFSK